uniref:Uncharacterized protein n=1 Tax=Rhizophora mucronata TaxID=61149 RepID=A0A2P2LJG6_RHIMU
MKIMILPS